MAAIRASAWSTVGDSLKYTQATRRCEACGNPASGTSQRSSARASSTSGASAILLRYRSIRKRSITARLDHQHVAPAPGTRLHPAPCTLHLAPCTLHPAPCTLHPAPLHLALAPCAFPPAPSLPAPPAPPALPGPARPCLPGPTVPFCASALQADCSQRLQDDRSSGKVFPQNRLPACVRPPSRASLPHLPQHRRELIGRSFVRR